MFNFHFECARCGMRRTLPVGGDSIVGACPSCGATHRIEFFPALLRASSGQRAENLVLDTESSCFFHPTKRAATACEGCGRFICALCEIDMGSQHLCPRCVEQGHASGTLEPLKTEYTRYDQIALVLAVLPLLFFYLTLFTAPMAIYFCVRHWRQDAGVLPHGRGAVMTAFVFAVLEVIGWIVVLSWLIPFIGGTW